MQEIVCEHKSGRALSGPSIWRRSGESSRSPRSISSFSTVSVSIRSGNMSQPALCCPELLWATPSHSSRIAGEKRARFLRRNPGRNDELSLIWDLQSEIGLVHPDCRTIRRNWHTRGWETCVSRIDSDDSSRCSSGALSDETFADRPIWLIVGRRGVGGGPRRSPPGAQNTPPLFGGARARRRAPIERRLVSVARGVASTPPASSTFFPGRQAP